MLDEADSHAGIETRRSRESNYRFLASAAALELLPLVGADNRDRTKRDHGEEQHDDGTADPNERHQGQKPIVRSFVR